MSDQIFRQKSMERVNSPDQLNEYIRVANPGVWMVLSAVIILLVGICIWGIFGRLHTTIKTAGVCEAGVLRLYVPEQERKEVAAGMPVSVQGTAYELTEISASPLRVDDVIDAYAKYTGGLKDGQWVYTAYADVALPDGVYEAQIVTESVAPMFFVVN